MKIVRMLLVVINMLLIVGTGSALAAIGLPTADIAGNARTTLATSPGFELINAVISGVDYLDGTSTEANVSGESIIGATVTISGAYRTGDYTFNNAIITVSDGSFNYVSAILSDVVFVTDGTKWYLNPGLDVNNPSTLNLSSITLSTDAMHPSRYIDELILVKGPGDRLGMKLTLDIFDGSVISGDSNSDIFLGLLDGSPPYVEPPAGLRTIGYWKNHDQEREAFKGPAVADTADLLNVFSTADELELALFTKGKKDMLKKAELQLAALLLNVGASVNGSALLDVPLNTGELEILELLTGATTGTIGDAITAIENAILTSTDRDVLENAKDLADEINNRDHNN